MARASRPAQADHRPLPPYIDPDDCVWEQVFPAPPPPPAPAVWLGRGPRVAVVVWEDITIPDPGERLYLTLFDEINTYAQDVADTGFSVAVFKFYGMAEDPDHAPEHPEHVNAHDLRWQLRDLRDHGGLAGVQLIGNCPYVLWETSGAEVDYECDFFLGDLDGALDDGLTASPHRKGVFDTWSGDEADVWVARIMARPSLVAFIDAHPSGGSWTEESILRTYFSRNHELRWRTFDAHANALLFTGCDCTDPFPQMEEIFGRPVTVDAISEPPDIHDEGWAPADVYLRDLASPYAHVYHNGFHGSQRQQLMIDTRPGSVWYGYPWPYTVCREHYLVEGFHPGAQPEHPGCANPATFSYVFETCANGSFAYYPNDFAPPSGACCSYPSGCEVLEHWDCVYKGGSFHPGVDCSEDCPPWSPEWPLAGSEPCIAEVVAFNPNPGGAYGEFENGAALTMPSRLTCPRWRHGSLKSFRPRIWRRS